MKVQRFLKNKDSLIFFFLILNQFKFEHKLLYSKETQNNTKCSTRCVQSESYVYLGSPPLYHISVYYQVWSDLLLQPDYALLLLDTKQVFGRTSNKLGYLYSCKKHILLRTQLKWQVRVSKTIPLIRSLLEHSTMILV